MDFIKINETDNVAVAIHTQSKDKVVTIAGQSLTLCGDIAAGHKVALQDFKVGDNIVKYGFPIGHATVPIRKGEPVNEKNIRTNLEGLTDYSYNPKVMPVKVSSHQLTFKGYRRKNGSVGVRNEIWIIPTVGCVNGVANRLGEILKAETKGVGVDAIVSFNHNYGCSQLGDDYENTRNILRDMILHPNAGAVLVVGLGCENNQPEALRQLLGDYDEERIRFLVTQQVDDEMEAGARILHELYELASKDERTDVSLSELKIGLKCGGSDGFSGITANPLLGRFSDFIVSHGGTTVLTEVPEMFGAETLLMERCKNKETFDKTVRLINDFKSYFLANSQPIYENPSPGNKAGGISTLEEKSLGCTQKSGVSPVCDVIEYGETLRTHGLNLLSAPGNDLVASTALAAAGCQLLLFTTGRGTPFGSFVPTVKISTNTRLYDKKRGWIDFNAGTLMEDETMPVLLERFIDFVVGVASGAQANNEKNGYREIAIFKSGVTL